MGNWWTESLTLGIGELLEEEIYMNWFSRNLRYFCTRNNLVMDKIIKKLITILFIITKTLTISTHFPLQSLRPHNFSFVFQTVNETSWSRLSCFEIGYLVAGWAVATAAEYKGVPRSKRGISLHETNNQEKLHKCNICHYFV